VRGRGDLRHEILLARLTAVSRATTAGARAAAGAPVVGGGASSAPMPSAAGSGPSSSSADGRSGVDSSSALGIDGGFGFVAGGVRRRPRFGRASDGRGREWSFVVTNHCANWEISRRDESAAARHHGWAKARLFVPASTAGRQLQ
jgi:hypothetical protein